MKKDHGRTIVCPPALHPIRERHGNKESEADVINKVRRRIPLPGERPAPCLFFSCLPLLYEKYLVLRVYWDRPNSQVFTSQYLLLVKGLYHLLQVVYIVWIKCFIIAFLLNICLAISLFYGQMRK